MSSILHPPESVRGMTKLEKSAFRVPIQFPVVEIDARDSGIVRRRVRLEPFLIGHQLKPLKNLMESETSNDRKFLVFNPDKVKEDETKQKILEMMKKELGEEKPLNFEIMEKNMEFENWDAKTIFRAILPEGIEYSSFTQTGHIIHCNFVDEILPFRWIIAEVLLNKVSNCKTVVQKGNIITNVYRNLDLELLAGEQNYVTEVKETGLRFKMDFSKVYWNSRLSHEHERVSSLFNTQSLVYDACCGIGPFVLPATLKKKPKRVMANDLNPESVKWLKVNVELNKIQESRIQIFNMDAKEFIRQKVASDVIDQMRSWNHDTEPQIHVVMNLPAYAVNFLPAFRGVLRPHTKEIEEMGGFRWKWNVYCYLFAKSHVDVPSTWYEEEARRMCDSQTNWTRSLVSKCHLVRTVSSRKEMFCAQLDLPEEFLMAEPLLEEQIDPTMDPEEVDEEEPKSKKMKN